MSSSTTPSPTSREAAEPTTSLTQGRLVGPLGRPVGCLGLPHLDLAQDLGDADSSARTGSAVLAATTESGRPRHRRVVVAGPPQGEVLVEVHAGWRRSAAGASRVAWRSAAPPGISVARRRGISFSSSCRSSVACRAGSMVAICSSAAFSTWSRASSRPVVAWQVTMLSSYRLVDLGLHPGQPEGAAGGHAEHGEQHDSDGKEELAANLEACPLGRARAPPGRRITHRVGRPRALPEVHPTGLPRADPPANKLVRRRRTASGNGTVVPRR